MSLREGYLLRETELYLKALKNERYSSRQCYFGDSAPSALGPKLFGQGTACCYTRSRVNLDRGVREIRFIMKEPRS